MVKIIASALDYLIKAIGKLDRLNEAVETHCGIPLTVTTDQRNVTPPSILVSPGSGSYGINGGKGSGSFSLFLYLPFFDDPVPKALELADIIGKDLYSAAGRGTDGCRIMRVSMGDLEESDSSSQSGIWILTMGVEVYF